MKTIKEIADMAGVTVRTLQYYDEVGLLKPTKVNEAGYRFYDERALEKLQKILFFKELDFSLKEIKEIMEKEMYSDISIFQKQRQLLTVKRNRLNRLLGLLERLEKGEKIMSFQEFDMSEYIAALEQFRNANEAEVIKHWGSVDAFNDFIQKVQQDEEQVAKAAIRQYGSIEKYTQAMKYNLEHFSEIMERSEESRENANEVMEKTNALYRQMTADLSRDVSDDAVQSAVRELVFRVQETSRGKDLGDGYWDMVIESYSRDMVKKIMDEKYGIGSSEYIAKALRYYFGKI